MRSTGSTEYAEDEAPAPGTGIGRLYYGASTKISQERDNGWRAGSPCVNPCKILLGSPIKGCPPSFIVRVERRTSVSPDLILSRLAGWVVPSHLGISGCCRKKAADDLSEILRNRKLSIPVTGKVLFTTRVYTLP